MTILKMLVRKLFNFLGIYIISLEGFEIQRTKVNNFVNKAIKYYRKSLENKLDSLNDSELLQFLELKYGGYVTDIQATIDSSDVVSLHKGKHTGGDRMNIFFHDYSDIYSRYLFQLKKSGNTINILEVGILNGTGLAIWSEYFESKVIYGFDYDLGNYKKNQENLLQLGAFKDGLPITGFYDQLRENEKLLSETFSEIKLDVIIDDALHKDNSIINTFRELQPYFNYSFVYFIEDNRTAWKILKLQYPQYSFYNYDEITVVTNNGYND
jgi:hypothetical protein